MQPRFRQESTDRWFSVEDVDEDELVKPLRTLRIFDQMKHEDEFFVERRVDHKPSSIDREITLRVDGATAEITANGAMQLVEHYLSATFRSKMQPEYLFTQGKGHPITHFCTLSLPMISMDGLSQRAEIFRSTAYTTKSKAKADAAFQAVRRLFALGNLNENLRLVPRVMKTLQPEAQGNHCILKQEDDNCTPTCPIQLLPTRLADFSSPPSRLFLYAPVLQGLKNPDNQSSALQSVAVALPFPLPTMILEHKHPVFFGGQQCFLQWQPVCPDRGVNKEEESLDGWDTSEVVLQYAIRFHKALAGLCAPNSKNSLIVNPFLRNASSAKVIVPPSDCLWQHGTSLLFPRPTPGMAFLDERWLEDEVLSAESLVHNLRAITSNNSRKEGLITWLPDSDAWPSSGEEVIVATSGGGNIFSTRGLPSNCKLTDKLKKDTTYAEHYSKKSPEMELMIQTLLHNTRHRLVQAQGVTAKLTLANFSSAQTGASLERHAPTTHQLVKEDCYVLGLTRHYHVAMLCPGLFHNLHTLLIATECFDWLTNRQPSLSRQLPLLSLVSALTPKLVTESINSERFEFFGDSVLKYATSVALFVGFPGADPMDLTNRRIAKIGNEFLCERAVVTNFVRFLRACPLSRGLEEVYIFPPLQSSTRSLRNANLQVAPSAATQENGQLTTPTLAVAPEMTKQVPITQKAVADMVEAVLGALYYHDGSLDTAFQYLQALGVLQIDPRKAMREYQTNSTSMFRLSEKDERALCSALGYTFSDPALLVQALTHSSASNCHSNERLEFLGDAVLDMVVVSHLFDQPARFADEGALTAEKSARTNNAVLDEKARKLGVGRMLFHSQSLPRQTLNKDRDEWSASLNGPKKMFADSMEAVLGAIFVDSGFDIHAVQRVVEHLGISRP